MQPKTWHQNILFRESDKIKFKTRIPWNALLLSQQMSSFTLNAIDPGVEILTEVLIILASEIVYWKLGLKKDTGIGRYIIHTTLEKPAEYNYQTKLARRHLYCGGNKVTVFCLSVWGIYSLFIWKDNPEELTDTQTFHAQLTFLFSFSYISSDFIVKIWTLEDIFFKVGEEAGLALQTERTEEYIIIPKF